jgi:hypothetical protein
MKRDKYMGMDVHQATTVVSVIDAEGKIVWETIVPTETGAIRRLIESISGPIHVTLEETTQAEWLYDLLQGLVDRGRGLRSSTKQATGGRIERRQS